MTQRRRRPTKTARLNPAQQRQRLQYRQGRTAARRLPEAVWLPQKAVYREPETVCRLPEVVWRRQVPTSDQAP